VRKNSDDDLGLVAPAVGEQRTDRTVDQAGDQGLLLGRTTFALEVATGHAAGCVGLLDVVDGERQEVDAVLGGLGGDDGGDDDGFAIGGDDGAVSLTGDLAGLELERTATPIDFD
jgi:hypothetical protein